MDDVITEAYADHFVSLCGFLESMTHDPASAEDTGQEAFARLAREVRAGRIPDNVHAWLFQVGRNLVVSDGRRRQTAERHAARLLDTSTALSPEEEVILAEERQELRVLLATLNPIDQTSLLMAALGYSGAEIGCSIGRTEAAVRTRICRARERIRAALVAASTG